jgi:hypothetical protein
MISGESSIPPIMTISTKLTELKKKTRRLMLEIQVEAWDRHINVAGLYQLIGSHLSPLDI